MAVSFASISGGALSWHGWGKLFKHLWHNLELLKHLWGILLAWLCHGCELFKHLLIGITYPAWLSAFQASLGHPILNGCQLFKHLWDILYPAWL